MPKYLSTDSDPLYRFHQWLAKLRVLEVTKIKTVLCVRLSHPFVERLIGILCRERLDRTLFWTATDLEAKLLDFQHYYNQHRTHAGRKGHPPVTGVNDDHIIKAANASGSSMNAMLKAQMLATALDVYFSTPGLGGNMIGAAQPLGGVKINLTQVCNMLDGSSGFATCSGTSGNAGAAFGGATSGTVSFLLTYAASQSNAGGIAWYGQIKAIQGLAKNTFDAINNQVANIAP
jgi:hypothetical protein